MAFWNKQREQAEPEETAEPAETEETPTTKNPNFKPVNITWNELLATMDEKGLITIYPENYDSKYGGSKGPINDGRDGGKYDGLEVFTIWAPPPGKLATQLHFEVGTPEEPKTVSELLGKIIIDPRSGKIFLEGDFSAEQVAQFEALVEEGDATFVIREVARKEAARAARDKSYDEQEQEK